MKSTLLQICQDISSSMGSDEFNSIGDSTESLQIANCVKQTYFNMVAKYDLPEHNQLFQLEGSGDSTMPVLMSRPQGINRVEWIRYFDSNPTDSSSGTSSFRHDLNTDITPDLPWSTTSATSITVGLGTQVFTVSAGLNVAMGDKFVATSGVNQLYGTVTTYAGTTLTVNVTKATGSGTYTSWVILEDPGVFGPGYVHVDVIAVHEFLDMVNHFNPAEQNVGTFSFRTNNEATGEPNSFLFNYRNDIQPKYCCIVSNNYVIFDSYDNTQDSSLMGSKTLCHGWVNPTFTMVDSFVPILDENMFPMLLNEAKSLAFFELKQMPHAKAELEIKRQRSALQKFKNIAERPSYFDALANYGRRGGGTGR